VDFHRCTIRLADGSPVATDVHVAIDEVDRDGVMEWFGTVTVIHLISLATGQRYQLVLDDGRTGEFLVRRNTFAGDVNRAVAIQGVGPLR
jgi:hypothetical protein